METKPVQQAAKKDKPSTIFNKKFELKGHKRAIATVKYSSDGKFLASAGADKSILVWDPFEGKQRATLEGHAQGVSDVSWSYDSRFLASGSDDNTVRVWDVEKVSGRLYTGPPGPSSPELLCTVTMHSHFNGP